MDKYILECSETPIYIRYSIGLVMPKHVELASQLLKMICQKKKLLKMINPVFKSTKKLNLL